MVVVVGVKERPVCFADRAGGTGQRRRSSCPRTIVADLAVLPVSQAAVELSKEYARILRLPNGAIADALHAAYATVYRTDYLVTWNLRHLASSFTARQLADYNLANRLHVPLIVTPQYLIELESSDEPEKQ